MKKFINRGVEFQQDCTELIEEDLKLYGSIVQSFLVGPLPKLLARLGS